jgi:hypothetical protein
MDAALEALVWDRAAAACEYCRMPQARDVIPFEMDHIIPVVHGGPTRATNLALACFYCNCYKGPHVAGIDPDTRRITRLFHPRLHVWRYHFRWAGAVLVGRTAIGRTTATVLRINLDLRVTHRQAIFIDEGMFPPD